MSVARVCVCVFVAVKEGERERGGTGLSSCALSIISDLTLRKTETGKVDGSERDETQRERRELYPKSHTSN